MFWISHFLIYAIIAILNDRIRGEQHKPWPQYSLQNMPKTQFTCHDKILGGYYADPETQCQMFHICVKVAGVGVSYVQDFRFLCPNSTAFDQEAQTCANWYDVDCNQSVLYYGSDNFDLYRLGSGYENKRAPAAEEDESVYHLQRAENGDGRRYKENRIDQKYRPDQPPNYTKHFESFAHNNQYRIINNNNNNNGHIKTNNDTDSKKLKINSTKRPIVSYYTPTSTTTTTERYEEDSKQDFDDIFKGSHSSNFFSNRQNGREDELTNYLVKQKSNEFVDFNKKVENTVNSKTRTVTTRIKRPLQQVNLDNDVNSNNSNNTNNEYKNVVKITKKITAIKNNNGVDNSNTTGAIATTIANNKSWQNNANKVFFGFDDYQTQHKIQPTTYNPNRLKTVTTKYNDLKRDKVNTDDESYPSKNFYKPTANHVKKLQKFEDTQQKLSKSEGTFDKYNEFVRLKQPQQLQQPQPFKPPAPSKTFDVPIKTDNEAQYYRPRNQNHRGFTQSPAPFSVTPKSLSSPDDTDVKAQGFASRGRINFKASTHYDYYEAYPTTSSNGKKFSTFVTKDIVTPTTFKPSTYKKFNEHNYYQTSELHTAKPKQLTKVSSSTVSTFLPTTINPHYNVDEDDGQYHPELYELDFPKNRLNLQRISTTLSPTVGSSSAGIRTAASVTATTRTTTPKSFTTFQNPAIHLKSQQQTSFLKEQSALTDLSDEDELFRGASSLNFGAASINKLRADIIKAEKTSQQYNSQYNPHLTYTTAAPGSATGAAAAAITSNNYTKDIIPLQNQNQNQHQNHNYNNNYNYNLDQNPHQYQNVHTNARDDKLYNENVLFSSTTLRSTVSTSRPSKLASSTTTTTTTTTIKNTTTTATQKSTKKNSKSNKTSKSSKKPSKRPPHADEDTSYDYAYYDTDTLSESPQGYDEYEIAEFSKTPKFK